MVNKMEGNVSEALDLHPLDLLICERCGLELPVPPDPDSQTYCPRCNIAWDKSNFSPFIRKQRLWVSEKGLRLRQEQDANPLRFSCVTYYRRIVGARQAIFRTYENQGEITKIEAIGMLISFYVGLHEGVLKLLGRGGEDVKQAFRRVDELDRDKLGGSLMWRWLATMQIKRVAGRPTRSDTWVLLLDAALLMFCPNAYGHLLCDALRLRSQEYKVEGNMTHQKRYHRFSKARRAVEVSCIRIWRELFNKDPDPPSQRWVGEGSNGRREEWWERVARQQGLIGPLAENDRFM